jgi:uncharacterized protein (DUF1015 family)
MAKITPFRGLLYNQAQTVSMADIVCPPYDIISPAAREALYGKSPYNVVRLEYGLESPADTEIDNRYTRAAALLNDWCKNGILRQDQTPAVYIYEMEYMAPTPTGPVHTPTRKLRGFICLVKLEDYDSGVVKPHETTLSGPKTDRLNLLRACKSSFSQIYSLFSDPGGTISEILAGVTRMPDREATTSDKVTHRIWSLDNEESIAAIVREMSQKQLFIADGHHRYDTALNYRNERRKAGGAFTGEEPYNYVAMFLASLEDPGITILPAHRILFNLTHFNPQRFVDDLDQFFDVERIDIDAAREVMDLQSILDTMEYLADRAHVFGMRIKGDRSYYLLTLRNEQDMDSLLPEKIPAYRRLDVSILHHLVIDRLLGIGIETHKLGLNIEYVKDAGEAAARVKDGPAEIVFFMNPTKVDEVKAVASAGERMPQKATYFYPKLLTGLVMHKID